MKTKQFLLDTRWLLSGTVQLRRRRDPQFDSAVEYYTSRKLTTP